MPLWWVIQIAQIPSKTCRSEESSPMYYRPRSWCPLKTLQAARILPRARETVESIQKRKRKVRGSSYEISKSWYWRVRHHIVLQASDKTARKWPRIRRCQERVEVDKDLDRWASRQVQPWSTLGAKEVWRMVHQDGSRVLLANLTQLWPTRRHCSKFHR